MVSLCRLHSIDFLILAEAAIHDDELVSALNDGYSSDPQYHHLYTHTHYIKIYTTYLGSIEEIQLDSEQHPFGGRYTAFSLTFPLAKEVILICLHLPSKLYADKHSQFGNATYLAQQIKALEEEAEHKKTLVIGDFNMDPFEEGMIAANAFHAIMDENIAKADRGRTLPWSEKNECTYFYNPMWGLMGDTSKGPTGTYFKKMGGTIDYLWHTFDQVILRPELLDFFSKKDVQILKKAGKTRLLNEKNLIDTKISDHLPIMISLAL